MKGRKQHSREVHQRGGHHPFDGKFTLSRNQIRNSQIQVKEGELREWLTISFGLSETASIAQFIQDGSQMCKIINHYYPRAIHSEYEKPTTTRIRSIQNIHKFFQVSAQLALFKDYSGPLFTVSDVYGKENEERIILSLHHLYSVLTSNNANDNTSKPAAKPSSLLSSKHTPISTPTPNHPPPTPPTSTPHSAPKDTSNPKLNISNSSNNNNNTINNNINNHNHSSSNNNHHYNEGGVKSEHEMINIERQSEGKSQKGRGREKLLSSKDKTKTLPLKKKSSHPPHHPPHHHHHHALRDTEKSNSMSNINKLLEIRKIRRTPLDQLTNAAPLLQEISYDKQSLLNLFYLSPNSSFEESKERITRNKPSSLTHPHHSNNNNNNPPLSSGSGSNLKYTQYYKPNNTSTPQTSSPSSPLSQQSISASESLSSSSSLSSEGATKKAEIQRSVVQIEQSKSEKNNDINNNDSDDWDDDDDDWDTGDAYGSKSLLSYLQVKADNFVPKYEGGGDRIEHTYNTSTSSSTSQYYTDSTPTSSSEYLQSQSPLSSSSSSSQSTNYTTVFGVQRGRCYASIHQITQSAPIGCPCLRYRQREDIKEGGECLNCGHYPVNHEELNVEDDENHHHHTHHHQLSHTSLHQWIVNFDQIQLSFLIGSGATGDVYRGKLWGAEVAVKKLAPSTVTEEFNNELLLLSTLRHPNCVLFIAATLSPLCIVTELYHRGSVYDIIMEQRYKKIAPISWEGRLQFAIDACLGMIYLHQLGIVHRDLKTGNLLVDENWRVAVADFGLSEMVKFHNDQTDSSCVGTLGYMAPEVIEGNSPSYPSDVYSFGIILWELFTGIIIHEIVGNDDLEVKAAVLRGERPEIPHILPSILRDLIERCWGEDPNERPTFEQIVVDLRKLCDLQKNSMVEVLYGKTKKPNKLLRSSF